MLFYLPSNFGGGSIAHFAFVLRYCRCLEPEGQQEREQRHDPESRRRSLHTNVPGLGVDAHDLFLDPGRYPLERISYLGVAHCLGGIFERRLKPVFLVGAQLRTLLELRGSHSDEHPDEHRPGHRRTECGPEVPHAAREAGDITRLFGGRRRLHEVLDDREDQAKPQADEDEGRGEAKLRRRDYEATRENNATDTQRKEADPYEAALRNPPSA